MDLELSFPLFDRRYEHHFIIVIVLLIKLFFLLSRLKEPCISLLRLADLLLLRLSIEIVLVLLLKILVNFSAIAAV